MDPLKDDSLPSYAESTAGPAPPLHQQIQSTRLAHISAVVHAQIMPLLNDRAARGLSHSAVALLPMASSDEKSMVALSSLMLAAADGADDADAVVQLPLRDPLDTPEFWRQPAVRADLHALLQRELAASHQESAAPVVEALPSPAAGAVPRAPRRSGFLSSFIPVRSREPERPAEAAAAARSRALAVLGPRVAVAEEEVCWRKEGDFGLWETETRRGVVVRVWTE